MSLYFEFKKFDQPGDISVQIDPARSQTHTRDNVNVTPTGSWATAVAAGDAAGSAEMVIAYNAGTGAVRIALDAAADPARYHILPPGTQRALVYRPELPLKVRTL